jgi:4-amino-4-deoxy-L-arabinose transferase-like glycosyltransferase
MAHHRRPPGLDAARYFGPAVALLASLVLATSYAFMYVHSGKSADTDALFTLLILLTVVALCAGEQRRWVLAWLGPIAAATFMLRGMAVLMPLALIAMVELFRDGPRRSRVTPLATAALACVVPVAAWAFARWQIDGGRFLHQLFFFDFVARAAQPLDEHGGGPFYYLDILQRHHYDWLTAAAASLALFPAPLARLRSTWLTYWRDHRALCVLIGAWVITTVAVPHADGDKSAVVPESVLSGLCDWRRSAGDPRALARGPGRPAPGACGRAGRCCPRR